MGLLDRIKAAKEAQQTQPTKPDTTGSKVSLNKKQAISLKKEEVHKVSLSKKSSNGATPLVGLQAKVVLVMDYSLSMSYNFKSGLVQDVLETTLPMALEFDDDGQMEVLLFENGFRRLPNVNIDNIDGYIQREVLDKKYRMGGTNYAPVMEEVLKMYNEGKKNGENIPMYVLFMTDGSNSDQAATKKVLKDAAYSPVFWQYVGIGKESFPFLEKLDDLKDRYVDNADFFAVRDPHTITYDQLLNEFPEWLEYPRVKDMLR